EPIVSDANEALGEDMLEKAADEFVGCEGDVLVALGTEADAALIERDEACIADPDSMRVMAEVFENLLGPSEGTLGGDHPVGTVECLLEAGEGARLFQFGERSVEGEFAAITELAKAVEELAAKQSAHDLDGEEIVLVALDPAVLGGREPTAGDHAMQMHMPP